MRFYLLIKVIIHVILYLFSVLIITWYLITIESSVVEPRRFVLKLLDSLFWRLELLAKSLSFYSCAFSDAYFLILGFFLLFIDKGWVFSPIFYQFFRLLFLILSSKLLNEFFSIVLFFLLRFISNLHHFSSIFILNIDHIILLNLILNHVF